MEAFVELLKLPNPKSPFNIPAAKLYHDNYPKYYKKALTQFRQVK